jgi:hypothetical protein
MDHMSKAPKILNTLYVKPINDKEFGVFTNAPLYRDSIVEFCAWLPVSQKIQILIDKNDPSLSQKLFINPDGIEKERQFAAKIADLDLQERLDRGLITTEQFKALLIEVANPTKLLSVVSHAILLGFGSLYRRSDMPNLTWEYDSDSKLYKFYTTQDIAANRELTYF